MSDEENPPSNNEPKTLVDDLGVESLRDLFIGKHGKLFSAAGRNSPVVEVEDDFLIMHPPNKPLNDGRDIENIMIKVDDKGILLDELGSQKRISGAKFNGNPIYILGECEPDSTRNLVAALDKDGELHRLYLDTKMLTAPAAFKLRNKTHDGELSIFSDLGTAPNSID
jgi:hypothetical protein